MGGKTSTDCVEADEGGPSGILRVRNPRQRTLDLRQGIRPGA